MIRRTLLPLLCAAAVLLPARAFPQATVTERIVQAVEQLEPRWTMTEPFRRRVTSQPQRGAEARWTSGALTVSISLGVYDSPAAAAKAVDEVLAYLPTSWAGSPVTAYGEHGVRIGSTLIAFQKRNVFARIDASGPSGLAGRPRSDLADTAARITDAAITSDVLVTTCVNGLVADTRPRPRHSDERLARAVEASCMQNVEAALAAGASPNARDDAGDPVLVIGARDGNLEMVKRLLKAGADPNAKGANGRTAVFRIQAKVSVLEALLDAGADVNARDPSKLTALLDACRNRMPNAYYVKALLAHGADVNARDESGNGALLLLVRAPEGKLSEDERLELLLAAGVDVNARNRDGESPLDRVNYLQQQMPARPPSQREDLSGVIRRLTEAGAK